MANANEKTKQAPNASAPTGGGGESARPVKPTNYVPVPIERHYYDKNKCESWPVHGIALRRIIEKEEASPFVDQETGRPADYVTVHFLLQSEGRAWDREKKAMYPVPAGQILRIPVDPTLDELAPAMEDPEYVFSFFLEYKGKKSIGGGKTVHNWEIVRDPKPLSRLQYDPEGASSMKRALGGGGAAPALPEGN